MPRRGFIKDALTAGLSGLASYPTTLGSGELRRSIVAWLQRRYGLSGIDAGNAGHSGQRLARGLVRFRPGRG
jgi:aspartate/methionine/tyrosine aminotransferase